jgi:hypothetical protein
VIAGAKATVAARTVMIIFGFSLRLIGLGSIGFAEDEINKVDAVRAYDQGEFTANAEHPMLMKLLMESTAQTCSLASCQIRNLSTIRIKLFTTLSNAAAHTLKIKTR